MRVTFGGPRHAETTQELKVIRVFAGNVAQESVQHCPPRVMSRGLLTDKDRESHRKGLASGNGIRA